MLGRLRETWVRFRAEVEKRAIPFLALFVVTLLFEARLTELADWVVAKMTASGLVADAIRGLIGPLGLMFVVLLVLFVHAYWDTRRTRSVSQSEGLEPAPEPPLGMLDFERLALKATNGVTRILNGMVADQTQMTATINRYVPRFKAVVGASTDRKIRLSREFASKLEGHVRKLDARETALRLEGEAMATNYLRRLEGAVVGPELVNFRGSIAGMRESSITARASASGWRESTVNLRSQNIQQSINETFDRLILIITKIVSDYDRTIRFTTDALKLIDDKTAEAETAARLVENVATQSGPKRGKT